MAASATKGHQSETPSYAEFWSEMQDIQKHKITSKTEDHGSEDELSRTPDEGEEERTWLHQAGYSHLVEKMEAGQDIEEDQLSNETAPLTTRQAQAVKKRVDTLRSTYGRKKSHATKVDIRNVFPDPAVSTNTTSSVSTAPEGTYKTQVNLRNGDGDGRKKGRDIAFRRSRNYDMGGDTSEVHVNSSSGVEALRINQRQPGPVSVYVNPSGYNQPIDSTAKRSSCPLISNDEVHVTLDHLLVKDKQTQKDEETGIHTKHIDETFQGVTSIDDLSPGDRVKVQQIAFIELSSIMDTYDIRFSRKKRKKKIKEHGLFGVSLYTLLDCDKKKNIDMRVPLLFKQLIEFLDREGLKEEGILRVPGSVARVKDLRQELEEKLYSNQFCWKKVRASDAASLLKQFLRELPIPLLTNEYLEAFTKVENIRNREEQLRALNLLVLLLPDVHRDCLITLLRFLQRVCDNNIDNKMNLNNVSMIMAPNLFMVQSSQGTKQTMQMEVSMATGTSNVMRLLIDNQHKLWEVPQAVLDQVRKAYEIEQLHSPRDKKHKKGGKKDKNELMKPAVVKEAGFQEGVIRVQAPLLTRFFTAIQLEPGMTAADIVAKCKRGSGLASSNTQLNGRRGSTEDEVDGDLDSMHLFEIGGNIGERKIDDNANMTAVQKANPNASWVIKCSEPLH